MVGMKYYPVVVIGFLNKKTIVRILLFANQDFSWDHKALQQNPVCDWISWWSSFLKQTLQ